MSILAIIFLAIGLSFDTFAVSLSSGICLPQIPRKKFLYIISTFAIFQSGLTFIGWLAGSGVLNLIGPYDHWIAFFLLLYIGVKMIRESFAAEDEICIDLRNPKRLITVSFATSIDALAVGISLAMIDMSLGRIGLTTAVIAFVTGLASAVGLKGGRKIGKLIGKRAEFFGGIILIAIGVKILIEHLDILY